MDSTRERDEVDRLRVALTDERSSVRLQAALAAGTHPDADYLDILLARCAVEPDFFVRDMLTWSLTRLPASMTVPRLLAEVERGPGQARSQALHTLSKIGDPRGWSAITPALLRDGDDDVVRSAWRAAVALVPEGSEAGLATELTRQLGRGDREVQLSLSRALAALGASAEPLLRVAGEHADRGVRMHARATEQLLHDPDAGFDAAIAEARRLDALEHLASNGQVDADR